MKRFIIIYLISCLVTTTHCKALTKEQWKQADIIAEVTAENWNEYGVLPSVAVSQAFIGIASGAESYNSLENGVLRYLSVINNGCYPGAPFERDYKKQIRKILDGGYCEPEGYYYSNILWSIKNYHFYRYDKMIPNLYTIEYSKKCSPNTCMINSNKAGKETVAIIGNSFFETIKKKGNKNIILVPDKKLDGKKVTIELIENVKG